ncbi:MAG: ATP-dependent DNA helicase [Gammaproteobacteria bacterium]|jgi:ATP-dependent DNA helicase DinG
MIMPSEILGEHGPLKDIIDGYQVRASQQALSDAIFDSMLNKEVIAAEAGTGIGKTFAYLIPAILSAKKVIISTGTKHLQDQLYKSDLPVVLEALDMPVKSALLKGRANYLCIHRLDIAPHLGFVNKATQHDLHVIREWSGVTPTGDIAELDSIAEDSMVWPMVTSTVENCLGGECDHWNDCHIVKARKQAQEADLLVINHHLLLADMTLKQEGFAELLPGAEVFIADEAHQLHEVASRFFGRSASSRQLTGLVRDSIAEQVSSAPDMAEIREYADSLEASVANFRLSLGEAGQRQAWNVIRHKPLVTQALGAVSQALVELSGVLSVAAERSRGLDQCHKRSAALIEALSLFSRDKPMAKEADADNDDGDAMSQSVRWFETWSRSFVLHATPVDVSRLFRQHTGDFAAAWLFTSATLQVNKDFSHFANGLGIRNYRSGIWESPFDYRQQSLLYLPEGMPAPSEPAFNQHLIEKARPVIASSKGRAFVLFTSYRAMHAARKLLQDMIEYPILMQGEHPKHQLLERFRQAGNAVLLGTSSFWEGVDVRGQALSCVIIDKLPFASPGDPVMQARIDAIRNNGGQPFMDYQLPRAVIALKQGVGRLIRDVNDFGVVMIGDPRITNKSYGRIFINSLPEMPVTSRLDEVEKFYTSRTQQAVA